MNEMMWLMGPVLTKNECKSSDVVLTMAPDDFDIASITPRNK